MSVLHSAFLDIVGLAKSQKPPENLRRLLAFLGGFLSGKLVYIIVQKPIVA